MSSVFFGGLPTDIDVRTLREHFGVPAEGALMSFETVAALIKTPLGSPRFRTVTTAWRKALEREHNIIIVVRQAQFVAAKPGDRIDLGSRKLRTGARAFRRAHIVVEGTDRTRLTEAERKQADHVSMTTATAMQAARLAARKPQPQLPQAVNA